MTTPSLQPTDHYAVILGPGVRLAATPVSDRFVVPVRRFIHAKNDPLEVKRAALSEESGCRLNLLRRLYRRAATCDESGIELWLVEKFDQAEPLAARFEWRPAIEVWTPSVDMRSAIDALVKEQATGTKPPFRQEWTRPGWMREVEEWVACQLELAGIHSIDLLEQMRSWAISYLGRINTDQGWIYFKAVPPYFASEPAATLALGERYPGQVPETIAIDRTRGWLLIRGFEGPVLSHVAEESGWIDSFRLLATIQHDFVCREEEIRAWGALIRPFEIITSDAKWLLESALKEVCPHSNDWPSDIGQRVASSLPALDDHCKAACFYRSSEHPHSRGLALQQRPHFPQRPHHPRLERRSLFTPVLRPLHHVRFRRAARQVG